MAFTRATRIRRRWTIWKRIGAPGTTLAGAPIISLLAARSLIGTTGASSSPAAARRRPRTTRCAGRARASSGIDVSAASIAFSERAEARSTGSKTSSCANFRSNAPPTSARPSTTSSARACCITSRIRMPGCARCATCSRPAARCTSWSTHPTVAPAFTCCRTIAGAWASAGRDRENSRSDREPQGAAARSSARAAACGARRISPRVPDSPTRCCIRSDRAYSVRS